MVNHAATAQQQAYIFLQGLRRPSPGESAPSGIELTKKIGHQPYAGTRGHSAARCRRLCDDPGPTAAQWSPAGRQNRWWICLQNHAALEGLAMGLWVPDVTDDAIEDLSWNWRVCGGSIECRCAGRPARSVPRYDLPIKPSARLCADIMRLRYPEIILEALESGDGERVERVMREHVMVNAEAIASCLPAPRRSTWHPAPRRAGAARSEA